MASGSPAATEGIACRQLWRVLTSTHAQKPSISEPPNVSCLTRHDPCWIWPKQFRRVAFVHLLKAKYIWQIHRSWYSSIAYSPCGETYLFAREVWNMLDVTCWSTLQQTNKRKIKFRNSFFYHLLKDDPFESPKNTWHVSRRFFPQSWFKNTSFFIPTSSTWGCKVTIPAISTSRLPFSNGQKSTMKLFFLKV